MGVLIDVRNQLKRAKFSYGPRRKTGFVTIHYNGPSVASQPNDLKLLQADARFHVDSRGWDGLSYHYAIGRDGTVYQCRDAIAKLAHSGVAQGNNESLAVLVITGEGDIPPQKQIAALEDHLSTLGINARYVLGHKEWPRDTKCPGIRLTSWLAGYRQHNSNYNVIAVTKVSANFRSLPSTASRIIKVIPPGTELHGSALLASPVSGDSMWIKLDGGYVHGSTVNFTDYSIIH